MKRKILCLFICSLMLTGSICGCESKNDKPSSSSEVVSTVDESSEITENKNDESFEYNGTFNEEVFRHIIQDINLKGVKVSMPCTLADFENGVTIKDPFLFKEDSMVTYSLSYNNTHLAEVLYYSDRELTDAELLEIEFSGISISPGLFDRDKFSVGSIKLDSDYTLLEDVLGNPTKAEFDGSDGYYKYSLSEKEYLIFYIRDKKINSITIDIK
ncbi:MAG: hypothetical protein IJN43_13995 [Ruminococcus sp.]|nr:hypothetical protein [Ruminococcus sp.]